MRDIAVIVRNIDFEYRKESSPFKCEYKGKGDFKTLRIVCTYRHEIFVFEISTKFLPENSSGTIHFNAEKTETSVCIEWIEDIVKQHIKLISQIWIN